MHPPRQVRRTDKFKGRRREDRKAQKDFGDFGRAFKFWAHFSSARPVTQLRVLVGSEDPVTFREIPPVMRPAVSCAQLAPPTNQAARSGPPAPPRLLVSRGEPATRWPSHVSPRKPCHASPAACAPWTDWLPGRYFVMESFKDITDNNNKLVDRYARLVKAMAEARASGAAAVAALEARGALKDEGMALVLQILLMSECDSLFGSYASNVAILVHDLMHARMVARRERLHAVDINGRTYCGCGASFCMKLERRSTREPRRAVRNMVEAFRGSNINAI